MWYLLAQTKRKLDQNPPAQLKTQITSLKNKTDQDHLTNLSKINQTKRDTGFIKASKVNDFNKISSELGIVAKSLGAINVSVASLKKTTKNDLTALDKQVKSSLNGIKEAKQAAQNIESKVSTSTNSLRKELKTELQKVKAQLPRTSQQTTKPSEPLMSDVRSLKSGLRRAELATQRADRKAVAGLTRLSTRGAAWDAALSGNMVQLLDSAAEEVSKAELDAAAADSFTKTFKCALVHQHVVGEETFSYEHEWATFEPVITEAESCTDDDIAAPTATWSPDSEATPRYQNGVLELVVTFDTDEGATKTYAEGDSVTVQIQVRADNKWLDHDVALVTKTYNVVA